MEIESIFSQPVARFVLRVCISIAGYFAQLLWKRLQPWTLHLTIWVAPLLSELSNIIKITKLEV